MRGGAQERNNTLDKHQSGMGKGAESQSGLQVSLVLFFSLLFFLSVHRAELLRQQTQIDRFARDIVNAQIHEKR